MESCDIRVSAKTLFSEKYLWDSTHTWFLHDTYESILIVSNIDFLICWTDGSKQVLRHDAVWTIVLGVDSEHKKIEIEKLEKVD